MRTTATGRRHGRPLQPALVGLACALVAVVTALRVPFPSDEAAERKSVIPVAASTSTADPGIEQDFINRINQLRASKGLQQLQVDAELTAIGRRWADHMSRNGLAHNPNFKNEVKQNWALLGENVGKGPDVPSIHKAFVDSPAHYKNLVEPRFEKIGVGVVVDGSGLIWTAHQFMQLQAARPAPPPPAPRPTTTPKPRPAPTAAPPPPPPPPPTTTTTAAPAPPPVPPPRLVLVLEQLHRLDAPGG